ILKSHWSAPLHFLGAAPFSIRSFVLVAGITVVALAGVVDFMTGQLVVQNVAVAMSCAAAALLRAGRPLLLVVLSWAAMGWRRGGPLEFDRSRDRLMFGPRTDHLTLPLSAIAGLQLITTDSLAVGGNIWGAVTADRSMLGYLLKWFVGGTRTYQ